MAGGGVVRLAVVWAMLEHCLGEYERRQSDHHWRVTKSGRIFPRLPLGKHGKRENPEIAKGHVRKLARFFGIEECAETFFASNP